MKIPGGFATILRAVACVPVGPTVGAAARIAYDTTVVRCAGSGSRVSSLRHGLTLHESDRPEVARTERAGVVGTSQSLKFKESCSSEGSWGNSYGCRKNRALSRSFSRASGSPLSRLK